MIKLRKRRGLEMKRAIALLVITALIVNIGYSVKAEKAGKDYAIVYGGSLSEEEKAEVLKIGGIDKKIDKEISSNETTSEEEQEVLGGILNGKYIGNKAISSVLLQVNGSDTINLTSHNITINKTIYYNIIDTAGITGVDVQILAPYKVSGACALLGIFKAYESLTGKTVDAGKRKMAYTEMSVSIKLDDLYGNDKANEIIKEAKNITVNSNSKEYDVMKSGIDKLNTDKNYKLEDKLREDIAYLMVEWAPNIVVKTDVKVEEVVAEEVVAVNVSNEEVYDIMRDLVTKIGADISIN